MAANQQSNMLLSMLNSAGMGSSPAAQQQLQLQQQQQPSFGQSYQPYQGFSPSNGTGWAPSSSQPPHSKPSSPAAMSSSAFSPSAPFALTDLFKKIEVASPSSPSTGGYPAGPTTSTSPPPNGFYSVQARATSPLGPGPNGGAPDQATMLLDMFKQMVPNPMGSPAVPAESTPTSPRAAQDQKQALLSVFQQSGENGLPREPVITHEKPSAPSPPAKQAPRIAQSPPVTSIAQPHLSAPMPQEPPKKSMFDFVSPFDAFERIPRRVVSKSATPVPTEKPAAVPQSPAVADSPQVKDTPNPTVASAAVQSSSRAASNAATSRIASPAPTAAKSNGSSAATGANVAAAPAPAPTKVDKAAVSPSHSQSSVSTDSNGPITITLDSNTPDLLRVEDSAAVQVQPISILKSVESPQTTGRTMGITHGWMVYPMKTRLRLIDRASGARLGITIPQGTQIIDMATSERHVAFITSDGNVSVYEVPASWTSDDPPRTRIVSIKSSSAVSNDAQTIGQPRQVEWTRMNSQAKMDRLVIGGDKGVVVVDVFAGGPQDRDMADVVQNSKVLTTEGSVVGFALNQTHQVMALLSDSWHLSLYNMATQNRVWHRRLTSSESDFKPFSITFCETNVLIGADNNQVFDLVQISPGPAVITTLQMSSGDAPAGQKYATYDAARSTLWIGRSGQMGMLALRYLLKGKPPIQVAQGETVQAFSRPVEFPLQECSGFELDKTADNVTNALFLCRHSQGYLQATIDLEAASVLSDEAAKPMHEPQQDPSPELEEEARGDTCVESEKEQVEEARAVYAVAEQSAPAKEAALSSAASSPARPTKNKKNAGKHAKGGSPNTKVKLEEQTRAEVSTTAEEVKVENAPADPAETQSRPADEVSPQNTSGPVAVDERALQQMFEKMNSQLVAQTSDVVSSHVDNLSRRIDAIGGEKFATDLSSKISKDLEASIETVLQAQITSSLVPAIQKSIDSEVRLAVTEATKSLPRSLSQQLLPVIQREVTSALDKAIEKNLTTRLGPAVEKAMTGIKAELKEMIQIQTEMAARATQPAPVADPVMEQIARDLATLGQQVAALQAHLSLAAPPAGPPPGTRPMPMTAQPLARQPSGPSRPPSEASMGFATTAPPPQAPQMPQPPADFEARVLDACSQQQNQSAAIYHLVHDFWAYTIMVLPSRRDGPNAPTTSAYISPAHLLMLLHRLTAAMAEWPRLSTLAPRPGMMQLLVDWTKRAAELLDTTDPLLRGYWPNVKSLSMAELVAVSQQGAADPRDLSEIVDIIQAKP